jgi:hypothetical protein
LPGGGGSGGGTGPAAPRNRVSAISGDQIRATGGLYGGGGGATGGRGGSTTYGIYTSGHGAGGSGAVRIIWGPSRAFPATDTANM